MHARWLAVAVLLTTPIGCARGRGEITPTTTGTDLRAMPRGRMTPLPFPGSSLARSGPTVNPEAATASARSAVRPGIRE